jgi:hypothetical protein
VPTVASELDFVAHVLAVFAAVLAEFSAFGDDALTARMRTLFRVGHGDLPPELYAVGREEGKGGAEIARASSPESPYTYPMSSSRVGTLARQLALGAGLAAGAYTAVAGVSWLRYGQPPRGRPEQEDPVLDALMPVYEAVERHSTRVNAPADFTLAAARDLRAGQLPLAQALFKIRGILLGASPEERLPGGVVDRMLARGWGVLAEVPGRELVLGSIAKPWEANVTFGTLPPDDFASFGEPGWVKIAWTLRADPVDAGGSIFRTETRVAATDPAARAKFRRYWSLVAPGVWLVRQTMLTPIKAEAERRARMAALA